MGNFFEILSKIYVRRTKKDNMFCSISGLTDEEQSSSVQKVKLNSDLSLCLSDLKRHLGETDFIKAVESSFERFDEIYRIDEVFDDLANPGHVGRKEEFIRDRFPISLQDYELLNKLLQDHARVLSDDRVNVSNHGQNWILEMLLYMSSLNSAEDIQTRISDLFDTKEHKLRNHAPYGDDAKLVGFMLQGRDICEQWSSKSRKRTLTEDEFRTLSWQAMAASIVQAFHDNQSRLADRETVIRKYLENKSMRVISSDLNGFYIMIEHYLSDICFLQFTEDKTQNKQELTQRLCSAWQTDMIGKLWGGRPLETWMEGVSKNGQWLIKVQSSQDGNEGHKTKELAGRCRALRLAWSHGEDPRNRNEWQFTQRKLPKLALVLDGDWDSTKKRNLYEAGWDWVGDVSQLRELRELIGADD